MEKVQSLPDGSADVEAALATGDKRRALTLLMARYGHAVYRFAQIMTRDRSLAEDVRQQVFVQAYRDLDDFAAGTSVKSWIFGIARHRCIDAVHARTKWFERYKNDPADEPEYDDDPGHTLDRGRVARMLTKCLAKLTPAAREAVVLRYQQDLSYDEAAAIVGGQPGTLQRRVARALPVLRRCMKGNLSSGASR